MPVPSAHQPFALTDEGCAQAKMGAAELVEIITAHAWSMYPDIDSSNMLRAWQTAQIVAQACGAKSVTSFDSLAERGMGCAANLTLVAFSRFHLDPATGLPDYNGQMLVFFIVTVAAAEVAVGLAIIVALYRARQTVNVEDLTSMRG